MNKDLKERVEEAKFIVSVASEDHKEGSHYAMANAVLELTVREAKLVTVIKNAYEELDYDPTNGNVVRDGLKLALKDLGVE